MSRDDESRPAGNGPALHSNYVLAVGHDEDSATTAYVAGLRRRRAASWRCPPLDCGRRDPWTPDPRPGMRYRALVAEQRAAEREAASWAMAVQHLAELGRDVVTLVPDEVADRWAS